MITLSHIPTWRQPLLAGIIILASTTSSNGQEVTSLDSVISRSLLYPVDTSICAEDTMILRSDHTKPSKELISTHGRVELGGIHGAIPFATSGGTVWNAYSRGQLDADLFGAPVGIQFDLGTDIPVRGQRNQFRIFFDPVRAAKQDRWSNAYVSADQKTRLDSLQNARAKLQRLLIGQEARILALREAAAAYTPPNAAAPGVMQIVPDSVTDTNTPSTSFTPQGRSTAELLQHADSLEGILDKTKAQIEEVSAAVESAQAAYQLSQTIGATTEGKAPLPVRFARGIRHLELGTCMPQGSEFLMNGTTLQGVSLEYVYKDLFLAFDHGKSFDDTWRNTDPVENTIRDLQQRLFLTDAQDLNPRRLTDLRVGMGPVNGTHFHVGFLHGKRSDDAGGGIPTAEQTFRTNHVMELDGGIAIKENHVLRLIHARSVVFPSSSLEDSGAPERSGRDLFNGEAASAWKAIWSSELHQTGTRLAAEGRYIAPLFQSFGVGFLRSGSRAIEARLDQAIGQRLRVRAKGSVEQRTAPSTEGVRTMDLSRAQIGATWKPLRALALTATYLPVRSNWEAGPENRTECYQLSAELRKRWRDIVLLVSGSSGLYDWSTAATVGQRTWNHGLNASIAQGERWHLGVSYSTLITDLIDTVPPTSNLGFRIGHRSPKMLSIDLAVQIPRDYQVGWTLALSRPIGDHYTLGLRGEQFTNYSSLFNVDSPDNYPTDQAWTMSISYQW